MAYIAGTDRTQAVLLPEVLDDYVGADNPVRFLDAFVAQLDLGALGFQRAVPAETGRPGYDPGDLLRLYLYGYLHRIRSSRRLEQETHRNVELLWLLRRLTPDFKTIADFRRDHPRALKGVCREFILLCRRLDLFGGELLAIDGSKFRAVNARDKSYTPARLATLQRDIDRTIARYLRELERQDEAEAGTEGPSAEALRDKIAALQQRRAGYAAIELELATSGETVRSLTDPDSRPMMSGGRIEVCYNVQTAVDAKHKLIVAEDVTNAAGDRDQLSPMATAAQEVLDGATPVVVADQGYYHGAEIKTCLAAGITPLVPRPMTSANEALGLFTKDNFVYDPAHDVYRCPAGETLTYRTTTVELGRTIKNYRTRACGRCALKPRCTRNKDGRKITRWADEHLLEDMEARLRRAPQLFRQRKALAEHPFGTMKRAMDQGYFLLKGLRKVRGEFSLTVLTYNLKRVLNLVSVPRLLEALA
ncbi:MAG: IS1182 family transposase [Candidatus Methylomirabilaceae bacterium]